MQTPFVTVTARKEGRRCDTQSIAAMDVNTLRRRRKKKERRKDRDIKIHVCQECLVNNISRTTIYVMDVTSITSPPVVGSLVPRRSESIKSIKLPLFKIKILLLISIR